MDKNTQLYGRDADGFMELIPRVKNVTGCSIHQGDDSAEYWKNRCLHAESKYGKLKKQVNRTYGATRTPVQDDDEDDDEVLARIEADLAQVDAELHLASVDDPPLSAGIGLSFGPGRDPKLYRVSDGADLEDLPKEHFVGGEIEIQPGRGFHIGFHWRRNK
ncbi:MAG: hypothetical protein NC489_16515 [Ruminococcus flavefaciens]|nr:hypothetical protein [Ruminococcus flavefaciens]